MTTNVYLRGGRPRHPDLLTPAEWEVLAGVREGLNNRAIAERRGCDVETVRYHLRNVRRKLNVQSRDELAAFPGRPAADLEAGRSTARTRRVREQIPLIETGNMARALDFYCTALEFDILARWPDEGEVPGWVALGCGGARLMVREEQHLGVPSRRSGVSRVKPNFYVEGLDDFRNAVTDSGYRCSEVRTLFYGAREFDVPDPDGNVVVFVEFAASEPGYLATDRITSVK